MNMTGLLKARLQIAATLRNEQLVPTGTMRYFHRELAGVGDQLKSGLIGASDQGYDGVEALRQLRLASQATQIEPAKALLAGSLARLDAVIGANIPELVAHTREALGLAQLQLKHNPRTGANLLRAAAEDVKALGQHLRDRAGTTAAETKLTGGVLVDRSMDAIGLKPAVQRTGGSDFDLQLAAEHRIEALLAALRSVSTAP